MKVRTVSASLRLSRELDHSWATVEVGATADLEADEDWQQAQEQLYQDLKGQISRLFAAKAKDRGSVEAVQPPEALELTSRPSTEHWCDVHQTEFRKYGKNGGTWYSHKGPDGVWCKEGHHD